MANDKEFKLEDYKGNYCMRCKTIEEAEDFCKFLYENGRRWDSGRSYLRYNYWNDYSKGTVYYFNEATYGAIYFAESSGYKILEWSDYMNKKNYF